MTRRISLVAALVTGLLALSSVAMAVVEEDTGDTLFNFGYDADNHFLVFNLSPLSSPDDTEACELQTDPTTEHDLTYTITDGDVEVADPTEDCSLQAVDVTGPAGQINHGMFMKAFTAIFDSLDLDHGRGCLVRHLAQSRLGKDDQIRTPDADPDFEPGTEGTVEFTTVLADCERGGEDEIENETEFENDGPGKGKGKAKGKGKGRPDSPGKSGSAPGRAGK